MCHSSSMTTEIPQEVDRSTNCHQFVVSVTFQMRELSEAIFKRVHGSLCQLQSVLCLEPRSLLGMAPTQMSSRDFGKHLLQLFGWLPALGGSPWLLDLEGKS